ncbi:MAG TPA: hypothetical protein VF161_06270 [Steroidobacteraceae bacterium]
MTERVVQITLGSTFRATWVSSGASANPIVYNVLSGSETLVSSYAGQSSGNGHYYVDAVVHSPGLWQGVWYSTVTQNTYVSVEWLAAFPQDTDQPGRYITWDDVVHRFTGFGDIAGAVKAASHYIAYAEAEIDAALGARFSVPFSNNNLTVRDLAIDMVYLRGIRGRSEEYKEIKADVSSRIAALLDGSMVMVTASAEVIQASNEQAWSSTQDYHRVFALLDDTLLLPSSDQLLDEALERGYSAG